MNTTATLALLSVLALWALWVFYLAVMNLKRARDAGTLHPVAHALGVPVLVVGYVLDCVVNLTVMSVALLELPRELTVSARVSRHLKAGRGWRQRFARWFCSVLLDTFDPSGSHCN